MTRYLVVGATGQVGSRVVQRLARRTDDPVRVVVRDRGRLPAVGVPPQRLEVAVADLRDPATLPAAVADVDVVVATANAVVPRPGDDVVAVDDEGYRALVEACVAAGVSRFVYASVPDVPFSGAVPGLRAKRRTEMLLARSAMASQVLRLPPFTEVWLALVGSTVVTGGDPTSALARPFWFVRAFRRLTGTLVERHGLMLVPGRASGRNAFLTVDDAAEVLTATALDDAPGSRVLECGGPQVLTWQDAAEAYSRALGRRVRVVGMPGALYRVLQVVLRPVSLPASNIMGMNRFMAASEAAYPPAAAVTGYDLPVQTTVEQVLTAAVGVAARR